MQLTTIRGRSTRFQRRTWVRQATRTTTIITRQISTHHCSPRHKWRLSSPMATRYMNTAMTRQDTLPTACPRTSRRIPTPACRHLRYQQRRIHIPCQATGKGHTCHWKRQPCRYGHWEFKNVLFYVDDAKWTLIGAVVYVRLWAVWDSHEIIVRMAKTVQILSDKIRDPVLQCYSLQHKPVHKKITKSGISNRFLKLTR